MLQSGLLVQPEQQTATYLRQEGREEEHSKFGSRSELTGVSEDFLSVIFLLREQRL